MSKIMNAIADGTAKEFKAVVNGNVRFVVELNGKFYINSPTAGRFFPLTKAKIATFIESSGALQ